MAGVNNLVTRGYGAFSNIGDVVTAGYSSGDNNIISDADAAKIASYVWREVIEDGNEAKEMMRLFAAILGGLLDKVGNQTPEFKSMDESKVRLRYSTDGIGNRLKLLLKDLT